MKKTTKFWLGLTAVGGSIWAWMRFGNRASLAASRVAPPGYTSQRYLVDGNGKQIAVVFLYPIPSGPGTRNVKAYVVPIDPNGRGYWTNMQP